MTSLDSASHTVASDAWTWWEARRLNYNLTLAAGGLTAYALAVAINYFAHQPVWTNWYSALGLTLFLGVGYLLVMGVANVFFLLGPAVEGWSRPADVGAYRRRAWALGRWGSLLVPFSFPALQLALVLAQT